MQYIDLGLGRFYWGDCFDVMPTIPDGVIDLVLCDLPYGTTQNKWDSVLPLDKLWVEYKRLCKGAIVLSAAQPFTSALVMSNVEDFKYQWVWSKLNGRSGHLNAKKQPLRAHEDILVFNRGTYNPQMRDVGFGYRSTATSDECLSRGTGKQKGVHSESDGARYPITVLDFKSVDNRHGKIHPTQKPVELWEYLIRTYTNEGDVVLDNCSGSGTTAIACENTKRRWVCIEKDEAYAMAAIKRIQEHPAPVEAIA
jgi:site-specific DNA-methyltransferase (adenine-specific)